MFKAIIFDMDGVLVDSMPNHVQALGNVFKELGLTLDVNYIYDREGEEVSLIINALLGKKDNVIYDAETIKESYIKEFKKIAEPKAFPGMFSCLQILKQSYKLAIVSGSKKTIVQKIIDSTYPDIFDIIISIDDVTNGKPSPEPYLQAINKLDTSKDKCLVVENAPLGVSAAKAANLCCIAVPTYLDADKLDQADFIVDNHTILIQYLLNQDMLKEICKS